MEKDFLKKIYGFLNKHVLLSLILIICVAAITPEVFRVWFPGIMDKTTKTIVLAVEGSIDSKLKPLIVEVEKNTEARIVDNIKDIEKQYEKLIEKPGDLYTSNLKHLFDNVIPNTPDKYLNETLKAKIKVLREEYEKRVTTGCAEIEVLKIIEVVL